MTSPAANLEAIAAFQSLLLNVLHEGGTPDEMRLKLLPAAEACGIQDYVRSFESRMLVVASELIRKWGQRNSQEPDVRG